MSDMGPGVIPLLRAAGGDPQFGEMRCSVTQAAALQFEAMTARWLPGSERRAPPAADCRT